MSIESKDWTYATGRKDCIDLWSDSNHYIFKYENEILLVSVPRDENYGFDISRIEDYPVIVIRYCSSDLVRIQTKGLFKNKATVLSSDYDWNIVECAEVFKLIWEKKCT